MKIAFILSTCAKSGPFIVARDIVNNLPEECGAVDIFYVKESAQKMPFKGRLLRVKMTDRTDLSQYDIIHSHGFLGDTYAFLNRRSIKGQWITTLHQEIKTDYSMARGKLVGAMLEKFWLWMVSKATVIVTLTDQMAKYYRDKLNTEKITIKRVYNGITPDSPTFLIPEIALIEKLKSGYTVMGISANLIYRKGIDRVIEAMALPEGKKLGLIVLGDGPERENLTTLAKTLGVQDRVLFLGFKDNAIAYFLFFDVYMMSSRSEGFGLCVIEAASQKVPVVCNDLPVFRELFPDNAVVRFNLSDAQSLVEAVGHAHRNRKDISDAMYALYATSFSAQAMATNYLKLYREALTSVRK